MMKMLVRALVVLSSLMGTPQAHAQTWERLGTARAFTNDGLGDFNDRWRTGGYMVSLLRARHWDGQLGEGFGDVLETRLRSEIIAPANLANPNIGTDRRYAGILSFGKHTHFRRGRAEFSLGADLVFVGPMTGMGALHDWIHNLLGVTRPQVLGSQIGNGVYPTLSFEAGRPVAVGQNASLRPFLEAQAGAETFVRVGADLTFGNAIDGGVRVRDVVSGHRLLPVGSSATGTSFVIGADAAFVTGSVFLPPSNGYVLVNPRTRVRAGVLNMGEDRSFFYGVTWLGREFAAQPTGQAVGTLSADFRF